MLTDESWAQANAGGELSDSQGFDQEPYYYSIQMVDVDHDGIPELIARAPAGVQTYKWNNSGWTMVSANGPFGDDAGFLTVSDTNRCEPQSMPLAGLGCTALRPQERRCRFRANSDSSLEGGAVAARPNDFFAGLRLGS